MNGGLLNRELRRLVWPVLLGLSREEEDPSLSYRDLVVEHKDTRQVHCDVIRTFHSFLPVIESSEKKQLQKQLGHLINAVMCVRPELHYFQGYNDIVALFLLNVGESMAFRCMERMSISYFRLQHEKTLAPVLDLLKLIPLLLRTADQEVFFHLEQAQLDPYYATSWILTWFSHDFNDLELIARLFDFFLATPPLMPIYLSVALITYRRQALLALPHDYALLHSFLRQLSGRCTICSVVIVISSASNFVARSVQFYGICMVLLCYRFRR